jgi:hypothetical protein
VSGTELFPFDDGITVPAPLSLRLLPCPFGHSHRVIVASPHGAVELQIRPASIDALGSGMSIEYHFRQPMSGTEDPMTGCAVLDGATCYPDGTTLSIQSDVVAWFRARDGQAIVDDLVSRHQATTWTLDDPGEQNVDRRISDDQDAAPMRDTQRGRA